MIESVNGFEIRGATVADVEALTVFGARTFFESFAADNTPEDMEKHLAAAWRPELQRAEILDPKIDTILALSKDELAGFAMLRDQEAPPEGVAAIKPVELWRFYVDKSWQGRGLARALMTAAEDRARARGGRELWLGVWERNARAQAFYRKCGFEAVGKKVFVVGSDPQRDDVMLRLL
jgi:ribosomal protein S18 acetylase RimI-like enzyme